jgi:hypothetical protein
VPLRLCREITKPDFKAPPWAQDLDMGHPDVRLGEREYGRNGSNRLARSSLPWNIAPGSRVRRFYEVPAILKHPLAGTATATPRQGTRQGKISKDGTGKADCWPCNTGECVLTSGSYSEGNTHETLDSIGWRREGDSNPRYGF